MSHEEVLLALQLATSTLMLALFAVFVVGYARAVRETRRAQARAEALRQGAAARPVPRPAVEIRPEPRAVPAAPPAPAREPVAEPPTEAEPAPAWPTAEAPPTAPARPAAEAPPTAPARPTAEVPPAAPRRSDFFAGLRKSRAALAGRLERLLRGRDLDSEALDEIEGLLFGADLGVRTAEDLLEAVRSVATADAVRPALEARAIEILAALPSARVARAEPLHVIMMVGVNGSGKTTSIGKLASHFLAEGRGVVVAAGDTYRAAAIDQLAVWAERSGASLVRGEPGGDPAAVAFDAVQSAQARGADVVIIDTAGRLQTDQGLMDELAKISRVVRKHIPEAPHETLLVLDANTGQNAIRQAQEFSRAVPVSGILLAKLDGTAKGGVVLGIAQEVGLPVRWVGVGEGVDDLYEFDPEPFARALFAADDTERAG